MGRAAIAVPIPFHFAGLAPRPARSVEAVGEVEVAMDYQSLGIGLSNIGSIEIEVLNLSPDQDQSLRDETPTHHECERHPNIREIEGTGDAGTQHTDAAPGDQTGRGRIFAEPHNKRSV